MEDDFDPSLVPATVANFEVVIVGAVDFEEYLPVTSGQASSDRVS